MRGLANSKLFRQQCYVDGRWTDAQSGATVTVSNPATGESIGSVPDCGADDTRRALLAAESALPQWRALTAKARTDRLRAWYERSWPTRTTSR